MLFRSSSHTLSNREPSSCRSGHRRSIVLAGLALALVAFGCESDAQDTKLSRTGETTTFKPLVSTVSPYETVTIRIDFERERIEVTPDPAVIWYESRNPISQALWTVRCVMGPDGHDEMACPPDVTVTIRPKKGCSGTLFGKEEITIREGDNAIPSGEPNGDELLELFRRQDASERFCDGRSKKEVGLMPMQESVHDYMWVYEVIVRRGGEELFRVDPEMWIEKDGSGG
jgi:hypothetical protein